VLGVIHILHLRLFFACVAYIYICMSFFLFCFYLVLSSPLAALVLNEKMKKFFLSLRQEKKIFHTQDENYVRFLKLFLAGSK
jgi:hypothetical protein